MEDGTFEEGGQRSLPFRDDSASRQDRVYCSSTTCMHSRIRELLHYTCAEDLTK